MVDPADIVTYAQIEEATGVPTSKLRIWVHRNTGGLAAARLGVTGLPIWDRTVVVPLVMDQALVSGG
jgi:hypothetical protein